jgi:hypothetical protein
MHVSRTVPTPDASGKHFFTWLWIIANNGESDDLAVSKALSHGPVSVSAAGDIRYTHMPVIQRKQNAKAGVQAGPVNGRARGNRH